KTLKLNSKHHSYAVNFFINYLLIIKNRFGLASIQLKTFFCVLGGIGKPSIYTTLLTISNSWNFLNFKPVFSISLSCLSLTILFTFISFFLQRYYKKQYVTIIY